MFRNCNKIRDICVPFLISNLFMLYNFYQILEISPSASSEEIKRAYREKAKLLHPDINKTNEAQEIFALVSEAYETLSNENKRVMYDLKLKNAGTQKQFVKNFHYDWESFRKAGFARKTPVQNVKTHVLFPLQMFVGFVIALIPLSGIFMFDWEGDYFFCALPGIWLVWDAWKGITGKKSFVAKFLIRRDPNDRMPI